MLFATLLWPFSRLALGEVPLNHMKGGLLGAECKLGEAPKSTLTCLVGFI